MTHDMNKKITEASSEVAGSRQRCCREGGGRKRSGFIGDCHGQFAHTR